MITNRHYNLDNKFKATIDRSLLTESFLSPVGLVDDVYKEVYLDSTVNTSGSIYMALLDINEDPLPNHSRVLVASPNGAIFSDTDLNLKTIHCEFEAMNEYTDDDNPIAFIRIYDAETEGNVRGSYELYAAGPPIRDERFFKWKNSRLIVDFGCKVA